MASRGPGSTACSTPTGATAARPPASRVAGCTRPRACRGRTTWRRHRSGTAVARAGPTPRIVRALDLHRAMWATPHPFMTHPHTTHARATTRPPQPCAAARAPGVGVLFTLSSCESVCRATLQYGATAVLMHHALRPPDHRRARSSAPASLRPLIFLGTAWTREACSPESVFSKIPTMLAYGDDES